MDLHSEPEDENEVLAQAPVEEEQCPTTAHQMSKTRVYRTDEQWHYEGEHADEADDVEEWVAQGDGTFSKLLKSASTTEDQQASAAHPTNEETASLARRCRTPGCDLADFHLGPCKTQQVTGPRQRRRGSVSVQKGRAKTAEEMELEAVEVEEMEEVVEVEEEVVAASKK